MIDRGNVLALTRQEQSGQWATQRARYMTLETISAISDTSLVSLSAAAD